MSKLSLLLIALGAIILAVALSFSGEIGVAAPLPQEATPIPNLSISDEYCLSCHGQPGQTFPLEDGSELDLYVDPLEHANSIHGQQGYACVQCHADVGEYPHPPFSAADRRDVTLQLNVVCQRCHVTQYELAMDSVHAQAQAEGNRAAAVCSDCHTAHAIQDWVDETTGETLPEARTQIHQTCAQCHSAIHEQYLTSVHGSALTDENNPDVPTCIDCHGVHNIEDPTTSQFRLASPQMCAECHADPARMAKYGISTDVFDTYVADFHGTTVTIFEKQSPDAETNKPVCFDCHGVHDIKRADDPEKGLQVKENMLAACQKCHPDAQENFPTAWLSHYIPSPDRYPLVYYVDLFYKFFIPTVVGGMSLLVVMDASRRLINRSRKRRQTHPPIQPEEEQAAGSPEADSQGAAEETVAEPAIPGDIETPPQAPIELSTDETKLDIGDPSAVIPEEISDETASLDDPQAMTNPDEPMPDNAPASDQEPPEQETGNG
jgi:hypothetical protein